MSKDWHNAFAGTLLLFLIIGAIVFHNSPLVAALAAAAALGVALFGFRG